MSGRPPASRAPDHVSALDFQLDQTSDGRILKSLNIVDEHTRESLDTVVARGIDADRTVQALDDIVYQHGSRRRSSG